jgi:hypothetical protein
MLLAEQMPVAAIARVVQEEDTLLWRLISRLVEAARAGADRSRLQKLVSESKLPKQESLRRERTVDTGENSLVVKATLHTRRYRPRTGAKLIDRIGGR